MSMHENDEAFGKSKYINDCQLCYMVNKVDPEVTMKEPRFVETVETVF